MKVDLKIILLVIISLSVVSYIEGCGGSSGGSSSGGSSTSSGQRPAHDIKTKSGLTNQYNKQVDKSQRVQRPMQGFLGMLGFKHSGQLVTAKDGSKHLIHNAGKGTVVTDAKYMSSKWKTDGSSKNVGGKATIGQFVEKGGSAYNPISNNCHDSSDRMGELGRKKRCVG